MLLLLAVGRKDRLSLADGSGVGVSVGLSWGMNSLYREYHFVLAKRLVARWASKGLEKRMSRHMPRIWVS